MQQLNCDQSFKESSSQSFVTLFEKCPYSAFLWTVFSRIRTESGEMLLISPNAEKADQKFSEYGHFLRSVSDYQYWRRHLLICY